MTDYSSEIDATEALRAAFRRHASGVSVITLTGAEGQPVGFTATSMTSLGANPPLASFNVASGSSTWPSLCQATHVAIHTLGQRNLALAQRMAADHTQRFTPNDWSFGAHGLPILNDATAVMICSIREIHNVDSNAVVIVNILEGLNGEEDEALLYYNRRYMSPGRALN